MNAKHEGDNGRDKDFTIIVNGRKKTVEKQHVSYEEMVKLAFDTPPTGVNIVFTIVFREGPHNNSSGTLKPGKSVKVQDGMIFDVTATDKS